MAASSLSYLTSLPEHILRQQRQPWRCVCSRSYILHRLGSESGSQGRRVPLAGACQPPAEYCRESSRQTHCRSGISTFEPSPETCSETSERMPCADGNTRVEVHVPPCVEVHAAHECVYNISNGEVYHRGELDGNVPVCESPLRRTLRVVFKSGGLLEPQPSPECQGIERTLRETCARLTAGQKLIVGLALCLLQYGRHDQSFWPSQPPLCGVLDTFLHLSISSSICGIFLYLKS